MKLLLTFTFLCSFLLSAQVNLAGYSTNEYDEQISVFRYEPEINVLINAPAADKFQKDLPVGIILYALPNGNSTAWTIGKIPGPGDDWHYGIQNIGPQTRYLRNTIKEYNVITVYLETDQKSWPAWKSKHSDYASIVKSVVDTLLQEFAGFTPFIILSGHSGGGRFIFSFLDAYDPIPFYVKRICFLDSDYGYETEYGEKISSWLKSSHENALCVLAYNDSSVTLNGKKIVSPTGGTWYRSRVMQADLSEKFDFRTAEDTAFIRHTALEGRIQIILKKNPANEIFHTVQVERNGFIHSVLSGTIYENRGYAYWGERVYQQFFNKN